jgi:hypothetical protein
VIMVRRRPLVDRDLLRPSTNPWAAENKDYHRFDLSHAPSGEPTSRSPPTGHAGLTERGDSSQTPASRFFLMIFHWSLAKNKGPVFQLRTSANQTSSFQIGRVFPFTRASF